MNKEIVFVTGASSDIGCALIKEIATDNMTIICHYNKNKSRIDELQKMVSATIIPIQADFTKSEEVVSLIKNMSDNGYNPSKIIHLPSDYISNIRFRDMNWDVFENNINIQIRSIFLILKEFLPKMAKSNYGKVVFMLSSYTINVPPKYVSAYVTVKYGLFGLMKALASEYSDKKININGVSPSMIETQFHKNILEKIVEMNAEQHPLKKNATVNDIVPTIKLLLSSGSDYINGISIPVTGGLSF